MKNHLFLFIVLLINSISMVAKAQDHYWVAFTNKNNTGFSFDHPEEYLSERAIERRLTQAIKIDSLDLPVNTNYIAEVVKTGARYIHSSKWLNGITVKATIDSFEYRVLKLPFVKEVQRTKTAITKSASQKFKEEIFSENIPIDASFYGLSVYQTSILNGQYLHNQNFRGQGMQIAVIDGGFFNANVYSAMDSLWANNQILGTRDFVEPDGDIFTTHYHGMSVLSCLAGNVPGTLIGTATKASYWLIRSEDTNSEFLIEEDNWVAAAEFADSAGVDIINTSLGYYEFDDKRMNHTYTDMDGKTTRVTKGANIAATRGILVFSSAGNEGNDTWKYIIAPSDGENVIGVGAVGKDSIPAFFTSYGPASGGMVKPNVAALGLRTVAQKENGTFGYINGTSFSSPVMAGMAACLWQAFPQATAKQVKSAIELSAHLYQKPDSLMGYGIPDMKQAYMFLMNLYVPVVPVSNQWTAFPNPVRDIIFLRKSGLPAMGKIDVELFSPDGKLIRKWMKTAASQIEIGDLPEIPTGILFLKITSDGSSETIKISKVR